MFIIFDPKTEAKLFSRNIGKAYKRLDPRGGALNFFLVGVCRAGFKM